MFLPIKEQQETIQEIVFYTEISSNRNSKPETVYDYISDKAKNKTSANIYSLINKKDTVTAY